MPVTERTFTVTKPVESVLDYLKDFGRAEEWDPGTESCTRIDSGPVAVGSSWHNVSKIVGRETELTYRLDRLEPGRLTFVGTNKTATSTDDITLTAVPGGTEINYKSVVEFHGVAKVASPLFIPVFARLGNETEESLTRVINAL
jgi:carbon monoxide dehydrogenase subunit G